MAYSTGAGIIGFRKRFYSQCVIFPINFLSLYRNVTATGNSKKAGHVRVTCLLFYNHDFSRKPSVEYEKEHNLADQLNHHRFVGESRPADQVVSHPHAVRKRNSEGSGRLYDFGLSTEPGYFFFNWPPTAKTDLPAFFKIIGRGEYPRERLMKKECLLYTLITESSQRVYISLL